MDPALYSALTVNSLARGYVRRAPCLEPKNTSLLVLQARDPNQNGPLKTTLQIERHQQSARSNEKNAPSTSSRRSKKKET